MEVRIGLSRDSDGDVAKKGRRVQDGTYRNRRFSKPPVTFDDFKNALDRFEALMAEALHGDRRITANKSKVRAEVVGNYELVGVYVQHVAGDDEDPADILGTAAYMSPEQARGRQVDRRTDIFAFGALLYEMLTARRVFDGEDIADTLSRVLQREPDWRLLPANLPTRIRDLLRLCLQKDPGKRRSDAADVRIDIEEAQAVPAIAAETNPETAIGSRKSIGDLNRVFCE